MSSFLLAFEDPLRVLQLHWDVLLKCFQSNPIPLAASLYSKRLISSDTRDSVAEPGVFQAAQKAAILLAEVEKVIGTSSGTERKTLFQEFCYVVKDHPVAGKHMKSVLTDYVVPKYHWSQITACLYKFLKLAI